MFRQVGTQSFTKACSMAYDTAKNVFVFYDSIKSFFVKDEIHPYVKSIDVLIIYLNNKTDRGIVQVFFSIYFYNLALINNLSNY
jgi:hypothetical protein